MFNTHELNPDKVTKICFGSFALFFDVTDFKIRQDFVMVRLGGEEIRIKIDSIHALVVKP